MAVASAPAQATWVDTTVDNWAMYESVTTFGSYHYNSTNIAGESLYEWTDSPSKTTVIASNNCGDFSSPAFGVTQINAGNTSFHSLGTDWMTSPANGQCFDLRGRTASGTGQMFDHDGVIRR